MRDLLRMIRIEHTLFALPFAFTGAFLAARGIPPLDKLLWITLAMVGARSAALAWNRLIDMDFDARNPRTQNRELPQGLIATRAVYMFIAANLALLLLSAYMLAPICLLLSPIAIFLLGFYSYTKRFTSLGHFVLGATLGLAPVGAWLGIAGQIEPSPILLWMAITLWVAGFDIIYQTADVDFDKKMGLHSVPVRWGITKSLHLALLLHLGTMICLFIFWQVAQLGKPFLFGLALLLILFSREVILVRKQKFGVAFNINLAVGVLIFFFTLLDLLTI